jgi:hypothetical protein
MPFGKNQSRIAPRAVLAAAILSFGVMVVTPAKLIAETLTNLRSQFPSLVSTALNAIRLALCCRNAFLLEAGIFGKCGKSYFCSFLLAIL